MYSLKNTGSIERLSRVILSSLLFIGGFFWLGSVMQVVVLVLSLVLLLTGISGWCPLYTLFHINRYDKNQKVSKLSSALFTILFLLSTVAGSYASIFFTKKIFLEDYNVMNNYYKQTLFNTGKDKRAESITNYDGLVKEYAKFLEKYSNYRPYSLRSDKNLSSDLVDISNMIAKEKDSVYTGNLPASHLEFEKIRPIFQDILKRNNFSLLAVSLVDFHDVMEGVIDAADKKDGSGVLAAYTIADEKLKTVELEANDAEIQAIRKSLEEVKSLAESGNLDALSPKAAELKSNFVKVYLKRG